MSGTSEEGGAAAPIAGEIGILERRRIEAAVIAPLYEAMCRRLGEAEARSILADVIRADAEASGARFAAKTPGGTDLATFADLQKLWTADDALVVDVLVSTPEAFDYDVRRCRYAETYREMGLAHIGGLLSCHRDGAFCRGYDPRVVLTRTTTLMDGGDRCDFRYRLAPSADGDPAED